MAVDAVYLYNEKKQIRQAIVWGVYELIHDEATFELDAEIDSKYKAKPGEFLGFIDVDGKLALFEINTAEEDESRGVTAITATEAPVDELAHLIVPEIRLTGASTKASAQAALSGSGWKLGEVTGKAKKSDVSAYMQTRWKVLRDIAAQYQVRIKPYYTMKAGRITGKRVDVIERDNVFRGRLFEGGSGGAQIYVTKSGAPITRMYGQGRATGTEDPPTCVTFADVAWSVANGDPADKPKGQTYIEDPDAIALYGEGREGVFNDKYIDDPEKLLQATWEELQKRKQPKVSGTATAADMEHIPGYEHKIVRMYDKVWVRTRSGEDVSAVVINIKRNYLHPAQTKIQIGEEADDSIDLIKKIAKISSTTSSLGRSSSSASNRYIETKQLIQLNADTIQMNARLIEVNSQEINLTASNLEEYQAGTASELNEVGIRMDAYDAELLLYAKTEKVDELAKSVGEVGIRMDAYDAELLLYAKKETVDGIASDVSDVYIRLDAAEEDITLKASKVYVDSEITSVKTLIAEEIEAVYSDVNYSIAESVSTGALTVSGNGWIGGTMTAASTSTGSLKLNGTTVSTTKIPVVTSFTQASGASAETKEYTLLTTAKGAETTHSVAAGVTKTF